MACGPKTAFAGHINGELPKARNAWFIVCVALFHLRGLNTSASGPQIAGSIWTASISATIFRVSPKALLTCKRPHRADVPRFRGTEEEAGLTAMIYSLICQLTRFRPTDDGAQLNSDTLEKLDGERVSADAGLRLLKDLLENTPLLRYCVISELSDLETDAGKGLCGKFLDMFFAHIQNPDRPVRLLFTTPGHSRVLDQFVKQEDQAHTDHTFQQIERRGQHLRLEMP
ncbi:hypothetical protein AJ80_07514 [Polytolypa hystricis UAMH7299]|uniref:Uncharacterized protein n=1 Tax=Polytolypa hystricis (strain UAMH7299) TaxID=1447883 RepID=A0A2B7XNY5_POLH7|nr:hypothetical protein AJ80_07514 [Polytolypa hystricis UAMH7299]